MRFNIYALFIWCVFTQQRLCAQNTAYQFSHLDISNGLSINQVSSIFQDSKGFMWFGTITGLNRYDGYKFRVYKHLENNANSLTDNNVKTIFEGPENKLWVITRNGFNIYNPLTERFSHNLTAELKKYNVLTKQITMIKKDMEGNFWFLTNNKGLYFYSAKNRAAAFYSTYGIRTARLHSNSVADVVEDKRNFIWLVYNDGVIEKLDTRANTIVYRSLSLAKLNKSKPELYTATLDNDENLWLFAQERPSGVFKYHLNTDTVINYNTASAGIRLNSNVINTIVIGDDNKIWIGTDHGGINIIDPESNSNQYVLNKEDDSKSLPCNSVNLYKDNSGIIWAGTFKQGICYYHKNINQFPLIRHYISDKNSLPYEDVDCFAEDDKGNLWIATNGGGLINYNAATKKYIQYKHNDNDPNSLTNNVIISLCIDHEHKLWIGTYFGGMDCFDGKKFIHYRHNDNNPSSISDDRVYSIIEDSSLKLWVGTFAGKINIFNRKTNSFLHPDFKLLSNYTDVIFEDNPKVAAC